MVSIIREKYLETVNGRTVARIDLCVDTVSELPTVNALPGRTIAQGSTARVINDGTIYGFKSDGTWVIQSAGSESYSDLTDKPSINGVTLAGDKSWEDLGLANPMHIAGSCATVADLPEEATAGDVYLVGPDDGIKDEYCYTGTEWEFIGDRVVVVDDALSTLSENPVQNKVIAAALAEKVNKDGTYQGLTAGGLVGSDTDATRDERQSFLFRSTAGSQSITSGDSKVTEIFGNVVNGQPFNCTHFGSSSDNHFNKQLR